MPPSGVDYASEFLNGYAPEYVDEPKYNQIYLSYIEVRMKFIISNKNKKTIFYFVLCSACKL